MTDIWVMCLGGAEQEHEDVTYFCEQHLKVNLMTVGELFALCQSNPIKPHPPNPDEGEVLFVD